MKRILSFVFGGLLLAVSCSIVNGQTDVRVGNDIGQMIATTFSHGLGVDDSSGGLFFDDLMVTAEDGSTFTFDYTITPGAGVGSVFNRGGFIAQLTDEGGAAPVSTAFDFDDGDVITFEVSDVTNGFTFEGFINFGSGQTAPGGIEGFFIGDIADPFLRDVDNNGDTDPRFGIALPGVQSGPAITFTSVGTVNLRGVALRFSNDPAVLLGDVDLSGFVDFADISPFIALLSSQTFQEEADLDESGVVDFADIAPFIMALSAG